MMNFLGRGYLARYKYNCINSWNAWDLMKSKTGVNTCEQLITSQNSLLKCTKGHNTFRMPCFQMKTALFSLNQVRFKNGCPPKDGCPPKLHRDLQFPDFEVYRKEQYADAAKTSWGSGDDKPGFTYVVSFFGLLATAYSAKTVATHFITYMAAAADVLALATIEVDISKIEPGACLSYKWRGKPLFIKHRTPGDIESEDKTPLSSLRDPQTPDQRTVKPEWLVVIGICTHLGCVPIPNSGDWPGGFYCPCHGSHYDNVGRARKGPAPLNLEVPPHKFMSDNLILIG